MYWLGSWFLLFVSVVGRVMAPKDVRVTLPGTCVSAGLQSKGELRLQMEIRLQSADLEMER